ncbi:MULTISPECIES: hypothetical protein [Photorhabdus]|uniref:Uncharacterized protein n=2 Tax=Photorhabdus asymbiotica TaxID=291112 RepID=C7BMU5_PHOAA|nr:hypothetical protein [Photorhabdus asymbiotica]RKS57751.1 hypothetical protein BDD30_2563 [Photorhabdus asymbiotica]CAQ82931.1 conserved hypothetical protein [Photorhabdus asymbiotica]
MIILTQEQFDKLIDTEDNAHIEKIRQCILSEHADLVVHEDEKNLHKRLKEAYRYLIDDLGFKDKKLIRSYLYLTAFNRDFHDAPEIKNALEAGENPEQQYKDILRIIDNLLKRRN